MTGIGNTPLLRLRHFAGPECAEIYVKWEGANPTGSMKDRMAHAMVDGAERRGQIRPGATIIDYTGGSTGSSLAMVCATRGYRAHFATADCFAEEKLQTMRAFGATLDVLPSVDHRVTAELIQRLIVRVGELAKAPNTYWTDQFNNPDNRSGYHAMAEEVIRDLDERFDEFIMGVGTGGCFSGNAEIYKERVPGVRCIAIEPAASRALSGLPIEGGHRLEGMGPGFVPSICRLDLADAIVAVTDADAYATARQLARVEGIFGGISSGANVFVALQRARELGPGHRIVTVICDSGLKYLSGDLFR